MVDTTVEGTHQNVGSFAQPAGGSANANPQQEQNKAAWVKILKDPVMLERMFNTGISMMQGQQRGESPLGAIGRSVQTGIAQTAAGQERAAEGARKQGELDVRGRAVTAQEDATASRERGERARATDDVAAAKLNRDFTGEQGILNRASAEQRARTMAAQKVSPTMEAFISADIEANPENTRGQSILAFMEWEAKLQNKSAAMKSAIETYNGTTPLENTPETNAAGLRKVVQGVDAAFDPEPEVKWTAQMMYEDFKGTDTEFRRLAKERGIDISGVIFRNPAAVSKGPGFGQKLGVGLAAKLEEFKDSSAGGIMDVIKDALKQDLSEPRVTSVLEDIKRALNQRPQDQHPTTR